jgi:hypothetical protein
MKGMANELLAMVGEAGKALKKEDRITRKSNLNTTLRQLLASVVRKAKAATGSTQNAVQSPVAPQIPLEGKGLADVWPDEQFRILGTPPGRPLFSLPAQVPDRVRTARMRRKPPAARSAHGSGVRHRPRA